MRGVSNAALAESISETRTPTDLSVQCLLLERRQRLIGVVAPAFARHDGDAADDDAG